MILSMIVPFAVWAMCALTDITSFKIPNRYVAVLLAAWAPTLLIADVPPSVWVGGLWVGGVLLLCGFALFAAGLLGAGDAKLIAASGLWIGPSALMPFLLYTTVIGAVFGIALVQMRRMPLPVAAQSWPWLMALHARERVMPYGVAIALGGMIALPAGALVGG